MTTHTWIEVGGGLALGIMALISFYKMRAMRGRMTRRLLFPFVSQLVMWTIFGVFFFSGLISVFYFAAIAAIYIPTITWIVKLPKDDHPA